MMGLGKLVKKKPDYSGLKNRTYGEEVEISKNYFFEECGCEVNQ